MGLSKVTVLELLEGEVDELHKLFININNDNIIPRTTETSNNLTKIKKVTDVPQFKCGLMNCRSVNNKSAFISDAIIENNFDCVALTETWLSPDEDNNKAVISSLLPEGYDMIHVPRAGKGGGVGFIHRSQCRVKMERNTQFSSFESMTVLMDIASFTFRFIIIYRVPPSTKNNIQKPMFVSEFGDLLEQVSTSSGKLLLLGDFNAHMDSSGDHEGSQLSALFESFDLAQHVTGPTHIDGHTLDLVISRATDDIVKSCEVGCFISDHNCIHTILKVANPHPITKNVSYRKIKAINAENLTKDIESSDLMNLPATNKISCYNIVLQRLLDNHAPVKTRSVAVRPSQPWIDVDILHAKRARRKAESQWRKTGLTAHRQQYKDHCEKVKDLIKKAKADFFSKQIDECSGDQKKLFQIVDKLLGRDKKDILPHFIDASAIPETFKNFFVTKIANIRSLLSDLEKSTDDIRCPVNTLLKPSSSKLQHFIQTTPSEIISIIKNSSKASCNLDPIPTSLLHDILPILAPVIADIVNEALSTGVFPSELKSAIVHPLLKKHGSDPEVLKNFRPVSNLSFISKVIEKVVASRLRDHMTAHDLLDPHQSAYRAGHSTETALLRVHSDIVTSVDEGQGVFLVLLDLSAAFDTVDHNILLDFLRDYVGLDGVVFQLFKSYLSGRTQCVSVEGILSEFSELAYGVPQGSVLGPIAFCIYTTALGAILRHYNINYHIYADDTQLYCSFDMKSPLQVIDQIQTCLSDIRSWMIKNKLKINDDKTEFLIITSSRHNLPDEIGLRIGQEEIESSSACKSLGVMLDQHINMDSQIKSVCRATHYHLRNISMVRDLLTTEATAQLVHSLITSRLDYCNSLLYGVPDYKMVPLQRVQNIAARIVNRSSRYSHITPMLKSLHWLPIKSRILFKVLLMAYKCINNLAPPYLCCLVERDIKERVLRSRNKHLLKVPDSRLVSYGDRSFKVAAAREWNKLPLHIKLAPTIDSFKAELKPYVFRKHFA